MTIRKLAINCFCISGNKGRANFVHCTVYVYSSSLQIILFRCCVAGMAYPTGNVPQNMIPLAKTSVSTKIISYIIVISDVFLGGVLSESICSRMFILQVYEILLASTNFHNPADKASYPHMRTLLEFDTREFLNVLSLVCNIMLSTYTVIFTPVYFITHSLGIWRIWFWFKVGTIIVHICVLHCIIA